MLTVNIEFHYLAANALILLLEILLSKLGCWISLEPHLWNIIPRGGEEGGIDWINNLNISKKQISSLKATTKKNHKIIIKTVEQI